MKAWLGLGGNLQQPVAQLKIALGRLGSIEGVEVLRTSGLYRTPPWGDESQDDFINAVVQIKTSLAALPLLHELQSIENVMGRQRSEHRWGPRLIDIDLLLYSDLQCICCFFVQKRLQLLVLVVLLQPILVRLQHEPRSQGAKRRIHHSRICPSP